MAFVDYLTDKRCDVKAFNRRAQAAAHDAKNGFEYSKLQLEKYFISVFATIIRTFPELK